MLPMMPLCRRRPRIITNESSRHAPMRQHGFSHMCFSRTLLLCLLLVANICQVVPYNNYETKSETTTRILFIVTTLNEYNDGKKGTKKGTDRLKELVVPVLQESVESMMASPFHYQVDVCMILGFTLNQDRMDMIRKQLPPTVGLSFWHDATPITYDLGKKTKGEKVIAPLTRALSRQHRYVIKDKLLDYDFFVVFEDDMLIRGEHVHQYLIITDELERLRQQAPKYVKEHKGLEKHTRADIFCGPMNKQQLSRMIPGFIRVEVLSDENKDVQTQKALDPIPVDLEFPAFAASRGNKTGTQIMTLRRVDPRPCCYVRDSMSLPKTPTTDRIFVWETGIRALGVREMPESSPLSWVTLLRGNRISKMDAESVIGDYWSGRNGGFGDGFSRPFEFEPQYLSNQGGWMATRKQIWEWHTMHCNGGFLPPFNDPVFKQDGLFNKNVEYWSGGVQLSQSTSCNLQRVVSLNPDMFSRHLIYHTANNKQLQLRGSRERFVKVDNLLGQLNAVRKKAEQAKAKE